MIPTLHILTQEEVAILVIKAMKNAERSETPAIEYKKEQKSSWGEKLARNLALSGIMALTIVSVRSAQLPSGQTVLTAVQEMLDPSWEDTLGKISFVGNFLPEAVSVFFETGAQIPLTAPCFGEARHLWTADEPYMGFAASDGRVYAAATGQVMSVAHGIDEERIVRVRHEDGIETLYYNLASVLVKEGDAVTASTCLGQTLPQADAVIEVRRAGVPVDPTPWISPREAKP